MRIALWLAGALLALAIASSCQKEKTATSARGAADVGSDTKAIAVASPGVSSASGTSGGVSYPGRRQALVIGNSAYPTMPLRNPANDARAVAGALRQCGFDVDLAIDCTYREMWNRVRSFGESILGGDVALFFYAGHGLQGKDGENYLQPIDADLKDETEIRFQCVSAQLVLDKMELAGTRVNIAILDACRSNPFARGFRASSEGLAAMRAASGTYIAFATAPHQVAADGDGEHSPFTDRLLAHILEPGAPIETVFKRVRAEVYARTDKEQTPWDHSSLIGDFYFVPPPVSASPTPWAPAPSPEPPSSPAASPEPAPLPIATPTPSPSPALNHPPLVEAVSPVAERIVEGGEFGFTVQAWDHDGDAIVKYWYQINGQAKFAMQPGSQIAMKGLYKGDRTLTVYVEDARGAQSEPFVYPFTVEALQTPPVVQGLRSLQERIVEGWPASFEVQGFDRDGDALAAYWKQLDGEPPEVFPGPRLELSGLGPGDHTLTVWLDDARGARSDPYAHAFRVDPQAPPTPAPTPFVTPAPPPPTSSAGADYTESAGGAEIRMIWIPGGPFQMGSPASEAGRDDDEGPVHSVALDGFWMAQTETTQGQYRAITGASPSSFSGSADLPVEQVSWEDAVAFCDKLSRLAGRTYTLPTEAQWEYACRAGSQAAYCFSNSESQLGDYAWYGSNSGSKTHPVRQKLPNDFGLYDMHGNVWEWCADWYADDYYAASPSRNPAGASSGSYRVDRGGSWYGTPWNCRSANRDGYTPVIRLNFLGFRVVSSSVR